MTFLGNCEHFSKDNETLSNINISQSILVRIIKTNVIFSMSVCEFYIYSYCFSQSVSVGQFENKIYQAFTWDFTSGSCKSHQVLNHYLLSLNLLLQTFCAFYNF